MKIIMIAVISANGKLTRSTRSVRSGQAREESNIYLWTSKEDQKFFASMLRKHSLIIMGSNTYKAAKSELKLSKDKLRIVMTRDPKKYVMDQVPGQLEFSNETPKELVNRLSHIYKILLLVGGSEIFSLFFEAKLIDEAFLTIEPIVFGRGKNVLAEGDFGSTLKLLSIKKFNKKGTILLKYKVLPAGRQVIK